MEASILTLIIGISVIAVGAVLFSVLHSMSPAEKKELLKEANCREDNFLFNEDDSPINPGSSRWLLNEGPKLFDKDN